MNLKVRQKEKKPDVKTKQVKIGKHINDYLACIAHLNLSNYSDRVALSPVAIST